MEGPSRSSRKYLVLEVWCGVLTVALVVMAALLFSIKPQSTEEGVSTVKPPNVITTETTHVARLTSTGSSLSHIQLTKSAYTSTSVPEKPSWQISTPGRSLVLRNDSVHFAKSGLYFIYAQVTFKSDKKVNGGKSVILKRDKAFGRAIKILVEGTFPDKTEGSVWVAQVVSLAEEDSVSLDVTGEFHEEGSLTFWGAYELR